MVIRVGRNREPREPGRRLSRREREARYRRILYIAMAAVIAAVVLLLGGGSFYEFFWRPRQALATVNGVAITQGDYWKLRKYTLISQIQQYQFFAAQNPQYQSYIETLRTQLDTVQQSPPDATTLSGMVDDLIAVQRVDRLGLSVTDADVVQYTNETFSPVPLSSPTPSPTLNPTAAAWSNQTATAAAQTPTPRATPATPGVAGSPAVATPATPAMPGTPATPATPASPASPRPATPATPAGPASPAGASPQPTPTPVLTPTPNPEQALATATASFGRYLEALDENSGMGREDYIRLVARPAIAKQKITDKLVSEIPDVQPQVHALHILLATRDGAEQARQAVVGGNRDFAEVAREQSTDTSTAPNGGDLGWFPRGVMVKEFEDVAFSLQVGEVSQPVQSKFGWHVIKVVERDDFRPLAESTLRQLRDGAYQKWLDGQRADSQVVSTALPTPTPPGQEPFEPPPDVPPTPIPTPLPTPTPAASPRPVGSPTGTP